MGYDVHITRAFAWDENEGQEIPALDWLAVIQEDTELSADPVHGRLAVSYGSNGWFDWFEGNVFSSEPDIATMTKAFQIARRLAAIVQDDEGDTFETTADWANSRATKPTN